MAEYKHLEFLDSVLKFIATSQFSEAANPPKYIFKQFIRKHPNAHEPTFDKAIEKLCKDRYLQKGKDLDGADAYKLTYEGIIFAEMNGYSGQVIRNRLLESSAKANKRFLTILTVLVALGTVIGAVFYLVELYWKYGWFR